MAKKRRDKHGKTSTAAEARTETAHEPRKAHHAEGKHKAAHTRRKLPNWPVLAVALAGMALAGFITGTAWLGESLPYCESGSPCDVVQSSRWAYLLGIPVAVWGFGAYAALAYIALRIRGQELHWKGLWTVSLIALAVSLYLTAIALFVLEAACPYCLASTGIAVALFALVAWQYPGELPGFAWPAWIGQTAAVAAIIVAGMHFYYSGWITSSVGEEDPYLKGLAMHLEDSGAQFYGAYWCGHCQEQKEMFGPSAERLPYVECTPGGRTAPLAPACGAQGISTFPTWIIDGKKHVGVLPKDELAKLSRYTGTPAAQ